MKVKILETKKQIKGELIQGSINGVDFKYEIGSECEMSKDTKRILKEAGYELEAVKEKVEEEIENVEEGSAE